MNILVLDFETYFDHEFTLSKLTTEAYIRDPRFEAHLLGWYNPATGARGYVEHEHIKEWMVSVGWEHTAVLCHHAQFDGLILSHVYGVKPMAWLDTLSMARLLVGNHVSASLKSLTERFDLPEKTVPYGKFRGVRWRDIPPGLRQELGEACVHDCVLTWEIFQKLAPEFPQEEYRIVDMTIRMFTEPAIVGDVDLFRKVQREEWERKNEALIDLGVSATQLQSSAQFCELLRQCGVEPEYKEGKNGPIPAVAATDDFMKELVDDENPRVASLAAARLDVRSTIDETRAGRLAAMAGRGSMPVYLAYCGAHTTRWSGGDRVNFQNFPRGGELRKALRAPAGYKFAIVDLSQIECRILNTVAEQMDVVEAFQTGRDLYSEGASRFYGKKITKKDNPTERHLGKVLELGCGYGMGAEKLMGTCRAGALGGPPIILSPADAELAIQTYRNSHTQVVRYWKTCDRLLSALAGMDEVKTFGPLEIRSGRIILPNGAPILYRLEYDRALGSWKRKTRTGWRKIWGGALTENIVQALARVVMSQAMLKVIDAGLKVVLTTHDEIVVLVEERWAQESYEWIRQQMIAPVPWLPGLPLEAEGGVDDIYSK